MEDRIKAIILAWKSKLLNDEEAKMFARNSFTTNILPEIKPKSKSGGWGAPGGGGKHA